MSIYKFEARLMSGESISLASYKGNVLLIVNTATQCGFTPQLTGLEELYTTYKEAGFTVLGFPCNQFGNQEPGTNDDVKQVCEQNYGVHFPLFEKIDVKGENAHPLFTYLTEQKRGIGSNTIKWNFTKFLVDRNGNVVERFAPTTKPEKIKKKIENLLHGGK